MDSDLSDRRIFIVNPEDVILSKLECYKIGGKDSENQWLDILRVTKTKLKSLGINYLCRMAEELQINDLLIRVLAIA